MGPEGGWWAELSCPPSAPAAGEALQAPGFWLILAFLLQTAQGNQIAA